MNLTFDSLLLVVTHLDSQSAYLLSTVSKTLYTELTKIYNTPYFWYLCFVKLTEGILGKRVTQLGGVDWKTAAKYLVRGDILDYSYFFNNYGVTSLSTVSLSEEMFGKIDWPKISQSDLLERGSLQVLELALASGMTLTSSEGNDPLEIVARSDDLAKYKYLLSIEMYSNVRQVFKTLRVQHSTRILQYLKEQEYLTDQGLHYIMSGEMSAEVLTFVLENFDRQYISLYSLVHWMTLSSNIPALEVLVRECKKNDTCLSNSINTAIDKRDKKTLALLLKIVTPSTRQLIDAVASQDIGLVKLLLPLIDPMKNISELITASNSVLNSLDRRRSEVSSTEGRRGILLHYPTVRTIEDLSVTLPYHLEDEATAVLLLSDIRVHITSSIAKSALWSVRSSRMKLLLQYIIASGITLGEFEEELVTRDNFFESLLLRAILIQGLQGVKLLNWMYLRERKKCILAARATLSDTREGDSLIQALFTKLLYPSLSVQEVLKRLPRQKNLALAYSLLAVVE